MKDILNIIDENPETCFSSFKRIAEKLMNDYKLRVNDSYYRIIECEFYFKSQNHDDPYVHGHERQKSSIGEWYFHGSGLDITLSTGEAFGGILLRSIAKVNKENAIPIRNETIVGPLKICTEIFKQFGNVLSNEPINFGLVDISREPQGANMKTATVFAIPRIGLNETKDNDQKFWTRPYRFISFLHLPHRETSKTKQHLVGKCGMSLAEYDLHYKGEKW